MKRILAALAVIGALSAGCTNSSTPRAAEGDQAPVVSQTTVAWNGSHYRWIGPKTYQNLAIYIIASDHHDETDFL
ncbi:MAG TPA: hypothetical protein VFF73_18760, partial [Planctomycetota bacterium]|nr:hypothetical protein [Planctomycetota bacterium]